MKYVLRALDWRKFIEIIDTKIIFVGLSGMYTEQKTRQD